MQGAKDMSGELLSVVQDNVLRNELKPENMSASKYESLVIKCFNRIGGYSSNPDKFKKRLKIYIYIESLVSQM